MAWCWQLTNHYLNKWWPSRLTLSGVIKSEWVKMSHRYRKSHCGDKVIFWRSYLHNRIFCAGKMASWYWNWLLVDTFHVRLHITPDWGDRTWGSLIIMTHDESDMGIWGLTINRNPAYHINLTHQGPVTHICISKLDYHWFRQWLVAYSTPSHSLNQSSDIVNWVLRNKVNEMCIKIHQFSLEKILLKVSAKQR